MFSLFKKKEAPHDEAYFPFGTDMHSHILPRIDDGSPDVETSLELIRGLMKLGIKQSIATPHIIGDMYRNDGASIGNALSILQKALAENNIDFKVSAAAEYMMDDYFLSLLSSGTKLLTLKDNYILTEFSYAARPDNVEQTLFSIITEGYRPILAHPERYGYFHNDFKQYDKLRDMGFSLQINLLSLTGYYGKGVQKAAHYLLKNDLVSFAGTDLHHARHMEMLSHSESRNTFQKAFEKKGFNEEL
jgi:protein-tyrosine phosphatase